MSETVVSELATSPLSQKRASREPSIARVSDNDSRSSSLSELEFGTEERDGTPTRVDNETGSEANDSEAETEKLENTPRKLSKAGNHITLNDLNRFHSPSKLSSHIPAETSSPDDGSPTMGISRVPTNSTTVNGNGSTREASHPLSAASDDSKEGSGMKRKRKRSMGGSSHTDSNPTQKDEPAKKRIVSTRKKGPGVPPQTEAEAHKNDWTIDNNTPENILQNQLSVAEEAVEGESVDEYNKSRSARTKKGKRKAKIHAGEIERVIDEEMPVNSDTHEEPIFTNDAALMDADEGESTVNNEEGMQ